MVADVGDWLVIDQWHPARSGATTEFGRNPRVHPAVISVESNKLAAILDRLKDSPCYGDEGSVSRRCEDLVDDLWSLYSGQLPYHVEFEEGCTGDDVERNASGLVWLNCRSP